MSAVRYELGVVSQRLRADAQALKFRNNILSLGNDHIVKRVYLGLRDERAAGAGVTRNGAKYLEQLAQTAGWQGRVFEKDAAKKEAREYVESRQNGAFKDDLRTRSTLSELARIADGDRRGLSPYLARVCPEGLRHGRRLKTKLRLGAHPLAVSASRMIPNRTPEDAYCKCCSAGVPETIRHTLFECPCSAFGEPRRVFTDRVCAEEPVFRTVTAEAKTRRLLADEVESEKIENHFYRFLLNIFASREKRLDSLAAGGRLPGHPPPPGGPP